MRDARARRYNAACVRARFFTIASALSLILCIACAMLLVRSYSVFDTVMYQRIRVQGDKLNVDQFFCRSANGGILCEHDHLNAPVPPETDVGRLRAAARGESGVGFWRMRPFSGGADIGTRIPLWVIAAVTAIPAMWLRRMWHEHSRFGSGQCPSCGYSLVGNRSGVCPECGKPVPAGTMRTA